LRRPNRYRAGRVTFRGRQTCVRREFNENGDRLVRDQDRTEDAGGDTILIVTSRVFGRSSKMAQPPSRGIIVLATVLGIVMTGGGLSKLSGESHQVAMFVLHGLPRWFLVLVGTFEMLGGILLLVPATTPIGSLVLSTLMVGALWTHAVHGEWIDLIPVTVLLTLFLLIFGRNRSRAVRLLGGA
jgi:putative oxidoreductase